MGRVTDWALLWFVCYTLVASVGPLATVADIGGTLFVVLGATAYTTVLTVAVT